MKSLNKTIHSNVNGSGSYGRVSVWTENTEELEFFLEDPREGKHADSGPYYFINRNIPLRNGHFISFVYFRHLLGPTPGYVALGLGVLAGVAACVVAKTGGEFSGETVQQLWPSVAWSLVAGLAAWLFVRPWIGYKATHTDFIRVAIVHHTLGKWWQDGNGDYRCVVYPTWKDIFLQSMAFGALFYPDFLPAAIASFVLICVAWPIIVIAKFVVLYTPRLWWPDRLGVIANHVLKDTKLAEKYVKDREPSWRLRQTFYLIVIPSIAYWVSDLRFGGPLSLVDPYQICSDLITYVKSYFK